MNRFKVGDSVKWESQARSFLTEKFGKVVAIKPSGNAAHNTSRAYAKRHFPKHRLMFDGFHDFDRETVLVEVAPKGKGKPLLYLPRVGHLEKVQ